MVRWKEFSEPPPRTSVDLRGRIGLEMTPVTDFFVVTTNLALGGVVAVPVKQNPATSKEPVGDVGG